MLNLTAPFSQRPAPIPKQARFVRGYAMSGCKEQPAPALPEQTRKAANEKMTRTKLSRRDEKYLPALKDWVTTADVAAVVGTSPPSAVFVLKRMVLEGLVEMRRRPGPKGGAAVKYEWRLANRPSAAA